HVPLRSPRGRSPRWRGLYLLRCAHGSRPLKQRKEAAEGQVARAMALAPRDVRRRAALPRRGGALGGGLSPASRARGNLTALVGADLPFRGASGERHWGASLSRGL